MHPLAELVRHVRQKHLTSCAPVPVAVEMAYGKIAPPVGQAARAVYRQQVPAPQVARCLAGVSTPT